MARLIKNIDTRSHGSLKAGRLLNGLMDDPQIAALIASGHAVATGGDEPTSHNGKDPGAAIGAMVLAFQHGYATAINDALDAELITAAEAGSCIFSVQFDDDTDSAGNAVESAGTEGNTAAAEVNVNAKAQPVKDAKKAK